VVQVLPHPLDDSSDLATALSALGRLWVLGASVSWNGLDGQGPRRRVPLPGYPFQRKRFLVPDSAAGQDQRASAGIPTHSSAAGPPGPTARAAGPTPESDHDCPAAELTPAASGNAVEEALREAFAQALGLELLSPADDFFDAGGDSLIATKLAAWSRRRFGVPLTAADVIRSRTVTGCADIVTGRLRADQASHGGRKEDV
jgi:acyl transferase domain-containing protein